MVRFTARGAFLLAVGLSACGGDRADSQVPVSAEQAAAMVADAVKGKAKEPVDPKALGDLMPADLDDLERTEFETGRNGAMGLVLTSANARYDGSDSRQVTIAITDIGALGGLGAFGGAAWAMSEFDRTTATGYERTTRFEGYKAMESQSTQGSRVRTELSVIVADRFVVQLRGRGIDVDGLKDVARRVGLRKLASLG